MAAIRSDHPSLQGKRTIFLKSITAPENAKRLLQPVKNNRKLGGGLGRVAKGKWRGMPGYQLTLEERATCPTSCKQWTNCYGNNMFLAKRIDHRDPWFLAYLESEIDELARKYTPGFVVRLHVLGDFYSVAYVRFWLRKKQEYPHMQLFGYTHRWPEHADGIGREIEKLNTAGAWIRFSDRGGEMSANVNGEGIQCPEQTGKTQSCMTCGLCWTTSKPVAFLPH